MSWELAYQLVAYAAFLSCVIAAIRIWIREGWVQGMWQLGALLGFVVAYWLLESWAHQRAPFYAYPRVFNDMIPYFKGFGYAPVLHRCATQTDFGISIAVPLMEGSLTFACMWTARLLVVSPTTQLAPYRALLIPFMAALAAFLVDVPLDPILSNSCDCTPVASPICLHEAGVDREHAGMGFWEWYAQPEANGVDDLFRDQWYGVPLFNYAMWYCAPVALVAFAILVGWLGVLPTAVERLIQGLLALTFGLAAISAPLSRPPDLQALLIALAILISLATVLRYWATFKRDNAFRWEFVIAAGLFALYPLVALLLGANGVQTWSWLLLVSLIAAALTLFYLIAPYWKRP